MRHATFGDISDNLYGTHLAQTADLYSITMHNPLPPFCYCSERGSFIDEFITQHFPLPLTNFSNSLFPGVQTKPTSPGLKLKQRPLRLVRLLQMAKIITVTMRQVI